MAGQSGVKTGDVVWTNLGDGDLLAFVQKGEHDVNGELKATVQNPEGRGVNVGYREPEDRDEGGAGLTFWLVK